MIPAVFDCGILASGIGWPGNPRACLILVAHRQVRLCVTKVGTRTGVMIPYCISRI